ncbi:MBL fold metallo-hydrolase [Candidatus Berkelbacteria bacterium]|nr:MBL fold metallo-hydrolase [Candidatus Berkelbacteria bacterium]
MQLTRTTDALAQVKTKQATLTLNDGITIKPDASVGSGAKTLPGPGEYEVADIFAEVSPDLAHFHAEDLTLAYLGHRKRAVTDDELGDLENVDVLLVAVDSENPDELAAITKLTAAIEPRIIVLIGADPTTFAKLRGTPPEVVETLKLSRKELPEEESLAYILK